MLKLALGAFAMIASTSSAFAQREHSPGNAFNFVCVGSQLQRERLQPLSEVYGRQLKLRVRPMPEKMVKLVSADSKFGIGIGGRGTALIVTYGEKEVPGFVSRNCSVFSEGFRYEDAKRFVEYNFQVSKPDETRQAGSKIAIYFVDLLGFQEMKTAIVVQADAAQGMASISLMSRQ